jgi:transposase
MEKQLVMPLNTAFLISNDESVRLLDQVLEELDYTKLYLTYSEKGRNPSADPRSLFKVLVYAYSQNIFSSRKIEKACIYDIRYRYLLQSTHVPDHNTINRFRKHHLQGEVLEDLFCQFSEKLMEAGEVSLSEIFIDGTKI